MLNDIEIKQEPTKDLVQGWAMSLRMRDWEEPHPMRHVNYRIRLTDEIVERGEEAVEILCSMLHDPDAAIRVDSIEMLGKIGSSQAVPYLLSIMNDNASNFLQEKAAEALIRIGEPESTSAAKKITSQNDIQYLLQEDKRRFSHNNDLDVIQGRLFPKDVDNVIENALNILWADFDEYDVDAKLRAFEQIRLSATEADLPQLVLALQSELSDFWVRELLSEPISQIGQAKYLSELLEALNKNYDAGHDNDSLCHLLIELAESEPEKCKEQLLTMLSDENFKFQSDAEWLLTFC